MSAATDIASDDEKPRKRRLWQSFSVDRNAEPFTSPFQTDEADNVKKESDFLKSNQQGYGQVVPALRKQLAEDGCTESQVYLARDLLIKAASDQYTEEERIHFQEKAMYWLLLASEQGHSDAVTTVKAMYNEGKGITEKNYQDVAAFVHLPKEVVLANSLSKELFKHFSKGHNYLTPLEVARAGDTHPLQNGYHKLNDGSLHNIGNQAKFTREKICESFAQYFNGDIPQIHKQLSHFRKEGGILDFVIFLLLTLLISSSIYIIYSNPMSNHMDNFKAFILFLQSLSTFFFLKTKRTAINQSALWDQLIYKMNSKVHSEKYRENVKTKKSILPFLLFFFFLSILVPAGNDNRQSFENDNYILLHCVFGVVFTVITIVGENFGFQLTVTVVYIFATVASQEYLTDLEGWANILNFNIPGMTWFYFALFVAALTLMLFKPLQLMSGFMMICWLYHLKQIIRGQPADAHEGKILLSTGITFIIFLCFRFRKLRGFCLILLITILLSSRFIHNFVQGPQRQEPTNLTWPEFTSICRKTDSIRYEVECSRLDQLSVNWQGEVKQVQLTSRNANWRELMYSNLAQVLYKEEQPYVCKLFGGNSMETCYDKTCQFLNENNCNFDWFAKYSFNISVLMPSDKLFDSRSQINLKLVGISFDSLDAIPSVGSQIDFVGHLNLRQGFHEFTITVEDLKIT